MKAEHVNPFIESVIETFSSMLDTPVKCGKPIVTVNTDDSNDVIGVIGLSGTVQGIVALKFSPQTALNVIGKMVGIEFKKFDSSIVDGVGELVNIIAGSSKVKFKGHKISISLPTVVKGGIYTLGNMDNVDFLTLPFNCKLGRFEIMVSLKPVANPEREAAYASADS